MSEQENLAKVSSSLGWTAGGRVISEGLRVGGLLFLTRLLPPEAFGLFLIVNTFVQGLATFSDFGVNASIVQNRSGEQRGFLDTAWTLQIIRGFLLWLICLIAAPFVADFYQQPELKFLIPVGALALVIGGFVSPTLPLLQRRLDLRRWVSIDIGVQLASVVSVLVLAWWTQSVWALVAGPIVTSVTRLIISHRIDPDYRPKLAWQRDAGFALLSFGIWILLNTPLGWLADNADRLAIARLAPIALVGVFHVATMIGGLPYRLLVAVGANAVFPMFSRAQHDGGDLAQIYRQVERLVLIVGALAVCGLLAVGPALVEILLDPRWHAAGAMLVPVAVAQWFRIVAIAPANALFALGYPKYLIIGNSTKLLGYLVFVSAAVTLTDNQDALVMNALWGFALGEMMAPLFYRLMLNKYMKDLGWFDLSSTLLLILSGGICVFGAVWLDQHNIGILARMAFGLFIVALFWGIPASREMFAMLSLVRDSRRQRSA